METTLNHIWDTQNLILALVDEFSPSTIKLHKLLFIAQYGEFDLPSNLVFAPFLYGPFCVELSNEILPALQQEGFIQTIRYRKDQRSPTIRKYTLTTLGKEMIHQWLANNMDLNKNYRHFIDCYERMTTEEIISESYDVFRKTITPRLLYFDKKTLHESTNFQSSINEKIRLKIPLDSDMMLDPVAEFVLKDFRESIPVFLSKKELYDALNRDKLGLGAPIKVYGCFHRVFDSEENSEIRGLFSHHFTRKNAETITEKSDDYDLICKLTKNTELCYYHDFLGHICEIGGIIVEENPLTIEPVYILGYYPREFQP